MKRWIIVIVVAIIGFVFFGIAVKLTGDLDAYHLAQPGPHGQFTGGGQGLFISFFVMFLLVVFLVDIIAFAIMAGMKWRGIAFHKIQYSSLIYCILCIPAVAYILCFSACALWLSIKECIKFLW